MIKHLQLGLHCEKFLFAFSARQPFFGFLESSYCAVSVSLTDWSSFYCTTWSMWWLKTWKAEKRWTKFNLWLAAEWDPSSHGWSLAPLLPSGLLIRNFKKYYFDYFLEPFSITLRPLRYTTVVQIESQGLNSAYAVQKILKSFGDIGRCNCWPKMSKVFKIKLPFLGAKCAPEEFWRNLGHIPPFSARQPWFLVF